MTTPKCYACDAPAVTKEHVPPRCFFPKPEETVDGTDYRVNLMTVPSCATHNNDTSSDDEYTWTHVVADIHASPIATAAWDKVIRDLARKQGKLDKTIRNPQPARFRKYDGTTDESFAHEVDFSRVERTMAKIAAAIWHDRSGSRLRVDQSTLRVFATRTGFFSMATRSWPHNELADLFGEALIWQSANTPQPDIFFYDYAILPAELRSGIALRLTFYSGVQYHVVSQNIVEAMGITL